MSTNVQNVTTLQILTTQYPPLTNHIRLHTKLSYARSCSLTLHHQLHRLELFFALAPTEGSLGIPHILHSRIRYGVHKYPKMVHILVQLNPFRSLKLT
jgi:hypothetical protein